MRTDLPISPNKNFKYSISFSSWDEESLEIGETNDIGYEIEDEIDTIGNILLKANTEFGIYMPVSFGNWESTEPEESNNLFEKGIKKYYTLHLTNEDGTEITEEENSFISFLLSDGRYEIQKFNEYAVGGLVIGGIALGVGALITYFYFKDKKDSKVLSSNRAKSVTHTINGKDRTFPIKDAWRKEHNIQNKKQKHEVPQEERFAMGGDASEHYYEVEYGEGGVARAKEIITNKIGLNEENADFLTSQSEKFAIWLADSIVKAQMSISNELTKEQVVEFLNKNPNTLKGLRQRIRGILDWLESRMTPKQNLRELSFIQAEEKAKQWHDELIMSGGDIDYIEPKENIILKTYPTNEFGKTYYWVMLPSNICDLESSRMGHCGKSYNSNNLISFRSTFKNVNGEEINDSHITIGYGDGLFYQVKGKQNKKPLEKYFPYIFDFIKSLVKGEIEDLSFNGFASEYASKEDYGWEDMTKQELTELYELNPNLFSDFAGKYMLYEAGLSIERPNTTIVIEKSPEYVADLLRLDSNLSEEVVEKVLTGETYDWFDSSSNSWSYYYDNAGDYVDNLNEANYEAVIDKIVEITALEKSVVKENGAKHYLNGDDEEFDSDNFDDIKRAIASAMSSAEENAYVKYYYEQIESALSELGTIKKLNYDGVEIEIDLSNLMSISAISSFLKDLDTENLEDVFFEAESQGEIELPELSIDDRYSAYPEDEDFNANFDVDMYEKGGSLRTKTLTKKTKIKNMKPSQRKAQGGDVNSTGISKEDYFLVVHNWVYFTFNYPMGFVKDAFNSSHLSDHLQEKFSSSYTRYGSVGVLMSFWANLDNENRRILSLWIKNNYFSSSDDKSKLLTISDDDYVKIISHWNTFCFNFPYGFKEQIFGDNLSHYEHKWIRAYESAGATGVVNKFFTELSMNNQRLLTDWVYDNYKGITFAGGGDVYVAPHKEAHFTWIMNNYGFVIPNREDVNYTMSDFAKDIKKTYSLDNPRNKEAYDYVNKFGDIRLFNSADMDKFERKMSEIEVEFAGGGRVTTNDGIIESFLTSERELKVGNLSTHYNEYDKEILLRNYGTLIAKRKGKNVEITNTKYSKTTTSITNKVKNMALNNRMNVKYVDKFADGGEAVANVLQATNLNKEGAESLAKILKQYNKKVRIEKGQDNLYKVYTSSSSGDKFADGGEASEWKIGDKFRVLKGIYGDYNSPRYANKEFEVINIRDGKYIDARTPKGTTETFDMKNIEKIKFADGGEADDVEQNFKVGNIVELSESGWDNENYHDFFEGIDNVKLVITDVYTNTSQHQGFDTGIGMALYSTKRLDNNEDVPFDLYDYELEYVSKGKKFADGGETFMTGGQIKEEWKSYLKESRADALVKAGYSKNVAKNLSLESWDSLEKQVQNAFKNVLISEEIEYMKSMMKSLYTYGGLDKENNYLAKYKLSLGNKLFNKTFNEYKKELEEGYDVDYGTYTDSEGLTYSSLRKKFADGGEAGEWSVTDISNAKYLGVIEFQDNEGEFHNFEIMETDDRLVFGGMTNSGFIESGYIEKDGFSTDETLQSLLEDLEVYYNDGGEYTSQIVFNQRMAKGGSVSKLKIGKDDFSSLLKLSDKELSKRLDLIREQQLINGKQYLEAKKKGENTSKIEEAGNRLQNQENAIIQARIKVNKMEKGGSTKYAKGGILGESARLEYITDAFASDNLQQQLRDKLGIETDSLGDNYVISFAYTDYGGDFLDKVAIEYFQETYPENTLVEATGWGGQNAYVFGEPAKEWIETTEDYPLGFEDIEDFYYEKQNEKEAEDFNYFLDEITDDYNFDREEAFDWLMENKSGHYRMTTQGLDFSFEDLKDELVLEGIIEPKEEDEEDEEYAGGGETYQERVSQLLKGSVKEYSVDIDLESGDNERELTSKSLEKAKKLFDKYAETMIYNDEKIENIQLVAVFKNGDYQTLDMKFSDYDEDEDEYAGGGETYQERVSQLLKGSVKEYSVDIDLESGDNERELTSKSLEKAKKLFDKYAETMIYNDERIENIQLVAVFKNGDYQTLDSKFSDYDEDEYAGGGRVNKMDRFISDLAKRNTQQFSVNDFHKFRDNKFEIGVVRHYFKDTDANFSEFDKKLGEALNVDWENQGKYAGGGGVDDYIWKNTKNGVLLYDKNIYTGISITKDSDGGFNVTCDEGYTFYKDFEPINVKTIAQGKQYILKEISYTSKLETGGEVEDWMEEALESLIEETGFDDLEISMVSDNGNEFVATDDSVEYRVFKTEDEAEEKAIEQVREDMQESPENFNKDFIIGYIDGRDFFENTLNEMNRGYAEDIMSESDDRYANRLISEMVDAGILDEDDALSENAEELAEERIEDFVNLMTEEQLNEGNNGFDYFESNFGKEEAINMVIKNNLIDIDSASRDAVQVDGIAHFLSYYDGETVYLSNDYVAYRIN